MSKKAIKKSEASASKRNKADRLLNETRGKKSNKGEKMTKKLLVSVADSLAAQLLIELLEEDGQEIDPALRAIADAKEEEEMTDTAKLEEAARAVIALDRYCEDTRDYDQFPVGWHRALVLVSEMLRQGLGENVVADGNCENCAKIFEEEK